VPYDAEDDGFTFVPTAAFFAACFGALGAFGVFLLNLPLLLTGKLFFSGKPCGLTFAFDDAGARPGRLGTVDSLETENADPRAFARGPRALGVFGALEVFGVLPILLATLLSFFCAVAFGFFGAALAGADFGFA